MSDISGVIGWLDKLLDATEAACWRVLGIESKGDK
jgi:hypothetical protein